MVPLPGPSLCAHIDTSPVPSSVSGIDQFPLTTDAPEGTSKIKLSAIVFFSAVSWRSLKNEARGSNWLSFLQQDWELTKGSVSWASAVRRWAEMQDGQRILLTTPSVLVGFRVEVYRAEGTTQWYTAVIVGYNESTKVRLTL